MPLAFFVKLTRGKHLLHNPLLLVLLSLLPHTTQSLLFVESCVTSENVNAFLEVQ